MHGTTTAITDSEIPFESRSNTAAINAKSEKITLVSTLSRFLEKILNTTGKSKESTNNSPKNKTRISLHDKEKPLITQALKTIANFTFCCGFLHE